ncbi:MAG: chloride channel protein [Cyclobacteriaceae bacterium]|nr:chloride channel protein [Cyclobacteriaceae bacterium]
MLLSVVVGVGAGLGAVIIKRSVKLIEHLLTEGFPDDIHNYSYFIYPGIGLFIVVLFKKFILKKPIGHGIPNVLYAISRDSSIMKPYQMFASVIASSITVGFGGSVGLEGPTVSTGAAIGSNIGRVLKLDYRRITLLLGCASAAAMSAIFKSPIAAIIFAIEVLMLDLTMAAMVPLLISSVTAALVSYVFMGQYTVYAFEIVEQFNLANIPYYLLLGLLSGFVSLSFTRIYNFVEDTFDKIPSWYAKLFTGVTILGVLLFFLPSLYGEGYDVVSASLKGDYSQLFKNSMFYAYRDNVFAILLMFVAVIFLKSFATSVTFGAGGIGGIFAPTLFLGANTGLLLAEILKYFGYTHVVSSNFALIGMCGLLAGVLHAPLTAIFLIAELTGGYHLFVPLMMVSTISYTTIKYFTSTSVYTRQLARKGELFTHDKDKMVISLMNVKDMLETKFNTVHKDGTLRDLVKVITSSKRNVFPVVDDNGIFCGVVHLNDIREVIFKPELYDSVTVSSLMQAPMTSATLSDSMEQIVEKFQKTPHFNIVVLDEKGKYVGFVSRANVFSKYRKMLKEFSED